MVVVPMRNSWRAVFTCIGRRRTSVGIVYKYYQDNPKIIFTLLMVVGRTSAEGMEKSQYL